MPTRNGNTVLFHAVRRGDREIVELLLSAGANVDQVITDGYDKGKTPLIFAAENNKQEIVRALLANVEKVNQSDNAGCTALYQAAYKDNLEIVKALLEKDADVNQANNAGHSPLYWAACNNNLEIVKELLKKGRMLIGLLMLDLKL